MPPVAVTRCASRRPGQDMAAAHMDSLQCLTLAELTGYSDGPKYQFYILKAFWTLLKCEDLEQEIWKKYGPKYQL